MQERAIDMDVITGLRELGGEDDPSLVNELIDLFLDDATQRVQSLLQSMQAGDIGAVGSTAHALKSASANLGAMGFSAICKEIEQKARAEGGPAELEPLVAQVDPMFSTVCSELREIRGA